MFPLPENQTSWSQKAKRKKKRRRKETKKKKQKRRKKETTTPSPKPPLHLLTHSLEKKRKPYIQSLGYYVITVSPVRSDGGKGRKEEISCSFLLFFFPFFLRFPGGCLLSGGQTVQPSFLLVCRSQGETGSHSFVLSFFFFFAFTFTQVRACSMN